jgi:hypothetical protein
LIKRSMDFSFSAHPHKLEVLQKKLHKNSKNAFKIAKKLYNSICSIDKRLQLMLKQITISFALEEYNEKFT